MSVKTTETTVQVKDNRDTGSVKLGEITKTLQVGDVLVIHGREVTVTFLDTQSRFSDRWLTFCARQKFSFPMGSFSVTIRMHRVVKGRGTTEKKVA